MQWECPATKLVERLTLEGFARCLHEQFDLNTPLNMSLSFRFGMGLPETSLYELAVTYTPFATGGQAPLDRPARQAPAGPRLY